MDETDVRQRFERIERTQERRDEQWTRLVSDFTAVEQTCRKLEASDEWRRRVRPFLISGQLIAAIGALLALWKAFHP